MNRRYTNSNSTQNHYNTSNNTSGACSVNRRKSRNNKPVMALMFTFIFAFVFVIGMQFVNVSANKASSASVKREYISIEVEAGDTLYDIAKEYMGVGYSSVDDYIKDIKSVNNITEDTVYAGKNIIIPKYVTVEE